MSAPDSRWRIRNVGAAWQMRLFSSLLRLGGRRPAYALADLVSLGYVVLRPEVRRRCQPYLRRRFPGRGPLGRLRDTWRLVRAFARLLVDRTALTLGTADGLGTRQEAREVILDLLGEARGLVVVTAHVGSWQLGLQNLGLLDCPVGVLAQGTVGPGVDPFAQGRFRRIDPEGFLGGIPDMLAILQDRGMVCIMGDRALGATVDVDFLGAPVALPFSPYKLASATGAPVLFLFPFKPDRERYEMKVGACLRIPGGLGRSPAAYQPYAQAFAHGLEAFLHEHPYQFFNFYDLWQTPEHP